MRIAIHNAADRVAPPSSRRPPSRLAVAAIVVVVIGGSVAAAYATGAMGIPANDDWDYARLALRWTATGHLHLTGFENASLIGHLVWGAGFLEVFGRSVTVLHWAGAVAAALGLVAAYALFSRMLERRVAVFAAAMFAVFPTYPLVAATYMSDATAIALQLACLALGLAGLARPPGRDRMALIALALACGLAGFTVREFAVAAVLAVLAGHAAQVRSEGTSLRPVLWEGAVWAILASAFLLWRETLAPGGYPVNSIHPLGAVTALAQGYFVLALSLLPALFLAGREGSSWWPPSRLAVGMVAVVVVLAALALQRQGSLLIGNYLVATGPLDDQVLVGHRADVLGGPGTAALMLAAFASGVGLAMVGVARLRGLGGRLRAGERPSVVSLTLVVFAAATVGVMMARFVTGQPVFDRYLWGVTVALAILLLRGAITRTPTWAHAGAGAALGLLALLSVVLVSNGDSYNVARWDAGRAAVRAGAAAQEVDAGYEWVGWHHRGPLLEHRRPASTPPRRPYLENVMPRAQNCVIVAASEQRIPGLQLLQRRRYEWLTGSAHIWIYRNSRACPSTT